MDSFSDRQFQRSDFAPKPTNNKIVIVKLTYVNDFLIQLTDINGRPLEGEDYQFVTELLYEVCEKDGGNGLYIKEGDADIHEPTNPPLSIGLVVLGLTDAGYAVLATSESSQTEKGGS